MQGDQRAILIVNTRSRRGREHFRSAVEELSARGVVLEQTHAVTKPDRLVDTVRLAVGSGVPLVVIGGGDGTLSSVLPCFVGGSTVYGVLPLGTGNQFARDLGIPVDLKGACDVLTQGKVGCVDLGRVNGKYFLNVATVGLTTLIAAELTGEGKRRLGRAVYFVALLRALIRLRPFQASLSMHPASPFESYKTLQIVIGNGRYHAGPFLLAPNASITDGRLVVYAIAGVSRWNLLKFALRLPGGHHVGLPEVPTHQVTRGELRTLPPQRVTVDGEIALTTPLRFEIVPRSLKVMVPSSFEETPFEETPFEETPFEETPFEETPFEETPVSGQQMP